MKAQLKAGTAIGLALPELVNGIIDAETSGFVSEQQRDTRMLVFSSGPSAARWGSRCRCAAVAVAFALFSLTVHAQAEYAEALTIKQKIEPQGESPFGEALNPYTGELTFSQADIVYEGTGPAIRVVRFTRSVRDVFSSNPTPASAFGGWSLSVPTIYTISDAIGWVIGPESDPDRYKRCTKYAPPSFFGTLLNPGKAYEGIRLTTDAGDVQTLMKRGVHNLSQPAMHDSQGKGIVFPAVTKEHWQVGCLPATSNGEAGEAFLAVSPEGVKYYLDRLVYTPAPTIYEDDPWGPRPLVQRRDLATMYVTRVEDRFGNWLKYNYSDDGYGDKLMSITASDGRVVKFTWDGSNIASIIVQPGTAPERKWTYQYETHPDTLAVGLKTVGLPDGSTWKFPIAASWDYAEFVFPPGDASHCNIRSRSNSGATTTRTMVAPSGLTGTFVRSPIWHGRNYVYSRCVIDNTTSGAEPYELTPPLFRTVSLTRKTFTGPGLPTQTWAYSYAPATGTTTEDACASTGTCPNTKWIDVVDPEGNRKRYTYSNRDGSTEGQLKQAHTYQGASTLLRTEALSYAEPDDGPYPCAVTASECHPTRYSPAGVWTPLKRRVITQQGATFTWAVTAFDKFARPLSVTKDSNISGNPAKTEVTTYHDNLSKWMLGQTAKVTVNGIVAVETGYDSLARPTWSKAFGKLQHTLTYRTDGTIATVKDGNNHITTLSNWKRGIPQTIGYPATPDQPSGESKSAVVNNDGTIASVTDENGYKTCYAYDAMGRIILITYPSETQAGVCDTSAWNATAISFKAGYGAARGLPAGHWRQVVDTGHGRRVTLFDALWRPVIEQTYDKTNSGTITATLSEVAKRYDTSGRLAFQSYPSNVAINFTDPNLKGTHRTSDALDRPLTVVQDSELGPLTTRTEYLSGFQTRVTNPRGKQTLTTLYMAYDEPTYEWPRGINHPEGAYTSIYRNIFGNPYAIARFSAGNAVRQTRWYVYDAHQQLCKTIDDESRATVMHYDGAGNLDWSAGGLGLASTTSCQDTDPSIATRKVTRSYDARNRIKSLVFPDHLGDTTYAYTPDNLLAVIEADNGGTNQVTTQYTYNRHRLMTRERLLWGSAGINWPVNYAYNANGHLSSQNWHGLTIDYAPNALGQPTKAGSYADSVSYYPSGAIKQFTYGNGIVHTMTQNARQLPERSRDVYGSTAFLDDSYDYDKNGNVAGISDALPGNRGDRTMTYDDLDRLTAATSPMFPGGTAYSYDVLDNLTRVIAPGRNHYYCYDSHWRLTNVKTGSCSGTTVIGLGYDVQGNLANKNGQTFDFDYGNRLRSVGSPASSYVYDGHGRRVRDYVGGSKYSQYNRAGQLTMTADQRVNVVSEYIHLQGSLVAIRERQVATGVYTTKYQHTDALGSPVAVTNQARTVLERREYEPYGRQLRPTAPVDGPGYTGHVLDAVTGLNYMQQRYYDPGIGRFLSVDPVTADGNTGANLNRYWYANNNPYRFADPDGRQPDCNACDNWSDTVTKAHKEGRQEELKVFEKPAVVATALMLVGPAAAALLPESGAASLVATGSASSSGGLIAASEAAGGHLLARHVGLSTGQLAARLAADTGIKAASTFTNAATAEASLNTAMAANQGQIASWLAGNGGGRLAIQGIADSPVGAVLIRGANATMESSTGRFVLQRASDMATGFRVITGYPVP